MATPTIREALAAAASGTSATVTTGAGTLVGDVLVCFFGNDFYTAAGMGAPTGTAGTWALRATGDNGTNSAHLKVYTRTVTVGGAQTVTVSPTPDEEVYNSVIVVAGADTSSPVDDAAGGNGAASTSHVAPAASPQTIDALLLCAAQSAAGGAGSSYTPPPGMTERTDVLDPAPFADESTASLVLTSSGNTGTKTFTFSSSQAYATASIAIKGLAASDSAGPWTGPTPGVLGPTGQWRLQLGDATTPLNVYVPAEAAGTGAAYDAIVDVDPAADQTAATGTGYDATTDTQVAADQATGSGTAYDGSVNVDYGNAAGPWTSPTPGYLGPTGRLSPLLGDATTPLNVYAPDLATGVGVGFDATIDAGFAADQSTGTGTAFDGSPDTQVAADQTAATGAAFDATATADYGNYAGPWTAPTPGRLGPTGQWTSPPADPTPAGTLAVPADQTAASAAAFDASVDVGLVADLATATGAAFDAVLALATAVDIALGAGAALDASAGIGAAADQTTGTGAAFDAATSVDYPVAGPWTWPTPGRIGPTGQWMVQSGDVGGTVCICVIHRPSSGVTVRPNTGITVDPCC